MTVIFTGDERGGFCTSGNEGSRADSGTRRDARSASGSQSRAAGHDGSSETRSRPSEEREQHRDGDERHHPGQRVIVGDCRRRIRADDVRDDGQDARKHHEFYAVADDAANRFFSEKRRPARDAEWNEKRKESADEHKFHIRQDNLDAEDDVGKTSKQERQNASKQNRQICNHVRPAGTELLLVFEDGIERRNTHQNDL